MQISSLSDLLLDFVHGAFCHVGILNFYLVKLINIFLYRLCFYVLYKKIALYPNIITTNALKNYTLALVHNTEPLSVNVD